MSQPLHVLLIEESEDDASILLRELRAGGYAPTTERVDTPAALTAALAHPWDVVIAADVPPGFTALAALALVQQHQHDLPVIVVARQLDEELAVAALQAGARDYLHHDQRARLHAVIGRELHAAACRRECAQAKAALRSSEAQLQLLLAQLPTLLWTTDRELRFTAVQGAALAALHLPSAAVVGRSLREVETSAFPLAEYLAVHQRAVAGETVTFETTWQGRTYHAHVEPIRDACGQVLGCIGVAQDITARTHAEAELRESEARFRQLAEALDDCVWVFSPDGTRPIYVSPAYETIWGRPRRTLEENFLSWSEAVHPDDRERVLSLWLACVQSAGDYNVTYRIVRPDGAVRWIWDRAVPIRNRHGAIERIAGIATDITVQHQAEVELHQLNAHLEQRVAERTAQLATTNAVLHHEIAERLRVEERLRRSELHLAEAQRLAHLGSWEWDLTQNGVSWSDELFRILGLQPQQVAGAFEAFLACVHPDDRAAMLRDRERFLVEHTPLTRAYRIVRPDGSIRHVQSHTEVLVDERGGHQLMLGAIQDITERTRTEAIMQESDERLRRLAEASFEGIIIHDQGMILDTNARFAAMLGYDRVDLIGKHMFAFTAPAARPALAQRLRAGNDQPTESIALRKDGTTFPVEIQSRPTPYQGRSVRVAAIRDVTERKQAEQERIAIERKLLETQKLESLGVLAGGVAHDFNNLLAVILGNASLALLKLPADSDVRGALEAIKTAAQHGADLPRQMLTYAGKGPAATQPIDLNMLVAEISDLLKASVGKNITLEYNLAPNLPLVDADPGQLRQVVLNLIINATEAIGEHEGRVTLTIDTVHASRTTFANAYFGETLTPGEYVRLTVSDTGRGMDAATQARIFEPFFTTKFIGRGLGLAVLLGIVRSHRGALTVHSTPGQGTTFTILLPAVAVLALPVDVAEAPRLERGSGTVLVIDDEAGVRSIAAELLEAFGFTSLAAADGQAGVAMFNRHADAITAVLLDLTLPGLSSAEICAALRARRPEVPIVLMSGYPEQQVAERLGGVVPAGFLPKPFTATQLQERILVALEGGARPGVGTRA